MRPAESPMSPHRSPARPALLLCCLSASLALAGCDRLTISPNLLDELAADDSPVIRHLSYAGTRQPRPDPLSEARFRWDLNEDAMATEKLAEGIRNFTVDQIKLEKVLLERL